MKASARHESRECRLPVIVLAVYALLIHSFVAGFAAAHPAAAPFQVICSSNGGQVLPAPAGPAARHELPDCCLTGCVSVAGPAPLASVYISSPLREVTRIGLIFEAREAAPVSTRSSHWARGPPSAVQVG